MESINKFTRSVAQNLTPWALYKHWISPPQASNLKCEDKSVLITGGTAGIGKETVKIIAENGCRDITMLSRNGEKANVVLSDLEKLYGKNGPNTNYKFQKLDLSSIENCKKVGAEMANKKFDVVIANAGWFPKNKNLTDEGYESCFAINHLGHYTLVLTLLNNLKKNGFDLPRRIVILSSTAHLRSTKILQDYNYEKTPWDFKDAYSNAKFCNQLFARLLSEKLQVSGETNTLVNSVHPGVVATELFDDIKVPENFQKILFRKTRDGAQTTVQVGFSEDIGNQTGFYFENCVNSEGNATSFVKDKKNQEEMWEQAKKITGVDLEI